MEIVFLWPSLKFISSFLVVHFASITSFPNSSGSILILFASNIIDGIWRTSDNKCIVAALGKKNTAKKRKTVAFYLCARQAWY